MQENRSLLNGVKGGLSRQPQMERLQNLNKALHRQLFKKSQLHFQTQFQLRRRLDDYQNYVKQLHQEKMTLFSQISIAHQTNQPQTTQADYLKEELQTLERGLQELVRWSVQGLQVRSRVQLQEDEGWGLRIFQTIRLLQKRKQDFQQSIKIDRLFEGKLQFDLPSLQFAPQDALRFPFQDWTSQLQELQGLIVHLHKQKIQAAGLVNQLRQLVSRQNQKLNRYEKQNKQLQSANLELNKKLDLNAASLKTVQDQEKLLIDNQRYMQLTQESLTKDLEKTIGQCLKLQEKLSENWSRLKESQQQLQEQQIRNQKSQRQYAQRQKKLKLQLQQLKVQLEKKQRALKQKQEVNATLLEAQQLLSQRLSQVNIQLQQVCVRTDSAHQLFQSQQALKEELVSLSSHQRKALSQQISRLRKTILVRQLSWLVSKDKLQHQFQSQNQQLRSQTCSLVKQLEKSMAQCQEMREFAEWLIDFARGYDFQGQTLKTHRYAVVNKKNLKLQDTQLISKRFQHVQEIVEKDPDLKQKAHSMQLVMAHYWN